MFNKRAFKDRVDLERKILSLINGTKISESELVGLSIPAIDKWVLSLTNKSELHAKLADIKCLLIEVSERLRLNSDKSRDVFESDQLVPKNTIDLCMAQLEDALAMT